MIHSRLWTSAIVALLLGASLTAPSHAQGPRAPHTPASKPLVSVKDSPGYIPLRDPDSLADKLGRRPSAPYVSMPFMGGERSLEALGRAVCGALHRESPDSMFKLCLNADEFRIILWPEFPQSRPVTGLVWSDGWQVLQGRLNGGSIAFARDFGGHVYTLVKVESSATKNYKNFKLHNGIVIVAKDDEGKTHRFPFIRSIAERKGRFKIYSMAD